MPRCSPVTCRRPGCRPSTPPEHSGSSIDRPGTPSRATSCSAPVGRTVPARRHCYALAAVLSPTSLRLVGWRSPWTPSCWSPEPHSRSVGRRPRAATWRRSAPGGATVRPTCEPGPGTARRCCGSPPATDGARSEPCRPGCGCSTHCARRSGPPSCGQPCPTTAPTWLRPDWPWRWPVGSRQATVEVAVCRAARHAVRDPREPPTGLASPAALAAALGSRVLIEYVGFQGHVTAVVVAGGRLRLHDVGSLEQVNGELECIQDAQRRLAHGGLPAPVHAAVSQPPLGVLDALQLAVH